MSKAKEMLMAAVPDWRDVALDEFNKETGQEFERDDDRTRFVNEEDGANVPYMEFEGNWLIFKSDDEAEAYAVESVKNDLQENPENFNRDFKQVKPTTAATSRDVNIPVVLGWSTTAYNKEP